MEILVFAFFVLVLVLMLTWPRIKKGFKSARKAVNDASERKEQQIRSEIGRQRQQYIQRQQKPNPSQASSREAEQPSAQPSAAPDGQPSKNADEARAPQEEGSARRTQTTTGETVIDHHHEKRENRKIYGDEDGEYVDFTEVHS